MSKRIVSFLSSFVILLVVVAGCGDGVKTQGTVKFSDGEPVTSGYVFFSDGTNSGRGEIKPDGTYSMGMLKDGEGLPPGKYKVYVTGTPARDSADGLHSTPFVDPKFLTYETTPLSIEIVVGKPVTYEVVVERNPAAR